MARVIFIGAGPGVADLMTLRGAARLREATVVLYDALTDPALRDLAPQAVWVDVGKRGFDHAVSQSQINELLLEHATGHAVVVRLKGGDPSLFGRLEEELETLERAGIVCEVVPGVTAALAAAAATLRPLTRRGTGRSVSFATAMTARSTCTPHAAPTPRSSTWPANSSPAWANSCSPPGGHPTRRSGSSAAPAGRTSRPLAIPCMIWRKPLPCTRAARPW